MKYPLINKRSRQSVNIPELAGGMNLRDSVSMVADNQLTDAVNMWFHDGVLKTRPGVFADTAEIGENYTHLETRVHDAVKGKKRLCSISCNIKPDGTNIETRIYFFWRGTSYTAIENISYLEVGPCYDAEPPQFFIVQKKDVLYCFVAQSYMALSPQIFSIDINSESLKWEEVSMENYYTPLVMSGGTAIDGDEIDNFGTQFEAYNSISCYYKIKLSARDKNRTSNQMIYRLLFDSTDGVAEGGTSPVQEMKITAILNGIEHSATYNHLGIANEGSEHYNNDFVSSDGYYLQARGSKVWFSEKKDFSPDQSNAVTVSEENWHTFDDLEIKAPGYKTAGKIDKIFNMTQQVWFGGASVGINGGTRLFLGGNTNADEGSLVVWSGLDEPLYFPENCYFYVGNSMQKVTAFGKQSDMLVIFKENETYYTQYTRNDSITAENLIDQSVVDYIASNVYFPLTLIHSSIGCDLPNTVQLCRNRLVWTNSNGKVYTLISNNQYSERNIYKVGDMIEKRLSKEAFADVSSADWEGHYVLLVKNHVYLMDYNSSGYQYAYSYQKSEDANVRIPWYYWELGFMDKGYRESILLNVSGQLQIVESYTGGLIDNGGVKVYCFDTDKSNDNERPIHSSLTTKLFDFGMGGYRKNVEQVTLMLGNNGGAPITVGFVTDCGTEHDEITLDGEETQAYTAGYIRALSLSPCIRSVLRFGVRLECDGPLAVDGMTLDYKILGGAR